MAAVEEVEAAIGEADLEALCLPQRDLLDRLAALDDALPRARRRARGEARSACTAAPCPAWSPRCLRRCWRAAPRPAGSRRPRVPPRASRHRVAGAGHVEYAVGLGRHMGRRTVPLDQRHARLAARDQHGVDRRPARARAGRRLRRSRRCRRGCPGIWASSSTLGVSSAAPAKIVASARLGSTMTGRRPARASLISFRAVVRVEHALGIVGEHDDARSGRRRLRRGDHRLGNRRRDRSAPRHRRASTGASRSG